MAIGSSVCPSCGTGITAEHQFSSGAVPSSEAPPSRALQVARESPWLFQPRSGAAPCRRSHPPRRILALADVLHGRPIRRGRIPRSISLVSAGFTGWLAVLVLAAAVAVGAWPLWRTADVPGWVPRVWLAVGAACLGGGLVILLMSSSLVRLVGGVAGSFGGASPLQVGFGVVLFVLGALAWTVVGGRRTWD